MAELTSIDLVLENCEVLTFQRNDIGGFWCDRITTSVARLGCNSITRRASCQEFFIELHPDADVAYDGFGDEKPSKFSRLMEYPDITHIDLHFDDGTSEYVTVPWCEEDEWNNRFQTHLLGETGVLCILVSADKQVADYADQDAIDDAEYMDVHWDLLRGWDIDEPEGGGVNGEAAQD